jgi:hypothetical protein
MYLKAVHVPKNFGALRTNRETGQGTTQSDWTLSEEWSASRFDRYDTRMKNVRYSLYRCIGPKALEYGMICHTTNINTLAWN